jgi:endonuclease/exonuclease/phosphatase family metal-dependent hydrolase
MTRNLYVGAALERVMAPGVNVPVAALDLWRMVQSTQFENRAIAIAREIRRTRPHLIGLNEVSVVYMNDPSTFNPETGAFGAYATDVVLDFEAILLDELARIGEDYVVAARATNFTAQVPMIAEDSPCADGTCDFPTCLFTGQCRLVDMRVQDYDLILVRRGVEWTNPRSAPFTYALGPPAVPFEVPRGWASVDASFNGRDFRFAVTHLEPADDAEGNVNPDLEGLQLAQAQELHAVLAGELPIILVGDLNTDAYGTSTATYEAFAAMGYEDAWRRAAKGYTCCEEEDLRNKPSILSKRVDLVLLHGDWGIPDGYGFRKLFAWRVGVHMTPFGLWPSDHAGVVAAIRVR